MKAREYTYSSFGWFTMGATTRKTEKSSTTKGINRGT